MVVMGGLLVSAVSFGAPLLLCDYRSPETDLTDMHLGFNYRYFDDPATVETDVSSGRLALTFSRLADAPEMGYTLAGLQRSLLPTFGQAVDWDRLRARCAST